MQLICHCEKLRCISSVSVLGWVVKKLLGRLSCSDCKQCLVGTERSIPFSESLTLLHVKNCGKLLVPADGVITVLMSAESHLRELTGLKVSRLGHLQLERLVVADVEPGTLQMAQHALETTVGINNHFYDVVRALVRIYFNVHSHHIVRLHNESVQSQKMRQKYTKLLLFKGE